MSDAPAPPTIEPRLAGIIWSNPKVGKTTYACSSPGKKWIINLDPEGYLSVLEKIDSGEVHVWDYSDQPPKELIPNLVEKIDSVILKSDIQPGDTVIFDSVTMMNASGLQLAIEKGIGAGQRGFTPTIEAPGISAYGARTAYLTAAMHKVLRATRRKKAHCWFLAHEDTPERNEKGDFLYQSILMSENALNQASSFISEIWWMKDDGNNGRSVFVRPTQGHRPMGSRMFRMDGGVGFKLKYDPEKPDLDQPHSIASLWAKFRETGKKLEVPDR